MRSRFAWVALATVLVLAGCEGSGSDIGPRLAPLPEASSKVSVLSDGNAGVCGARVTIVGAGIEAITGRNGRAELFASPAGDRLVRVDGSAAAAQDGDRLGTLTVALPLPGGDVPRAFFLPDANAGGASTVAVGTQGTTTNVLAPASIGGQLVIQSGSSVGITGTAANVTVRTGALAPQHLPGQLPAGILFGAGIYIDPLDLTITPGADLTLGYDLGASGTVTLYRLDDATGTWLTAGTGTVGSGSITAAGAVTMGGLYAFGAPVTTGSVTGRVVDAASTPAISVFNALVNVDGRWGTTDGNGEFSVAGVPAFAGDNTTARSATIELFAGGTWLPAVATASVTMNGAGEADAGEIVFDTLRAGNIRVQQVKRARAERFRLQRVSSLDGGVTRATLSDANGQAIIEDVPARWFGFQDAFAKDRTFSFYSQATGFNAAGRRWLDIFQFYDEFTWFAGSRSSRVIISDAVGTGPVFDASLVRGSMAGEGFAGFSRETGLLFSERAFDGRATAVVRTAREGVTVIHALSIVRPDGEKLEMPLRQAYRTSLGRFDRHGLVAGTITGANGSATHELRATRRLRLREWWEEVVDGFTIPSALPVDVDPATTHGAFQVGIDKVGGNIVTAELDTSSGRRLDKLAVATGVAAQEGTVTALDVPLDHVANVTYTAAGALAALEPTLAGGFAVDLALSDRDGFAVDVTRALTGNHTVSGNDLALTLPALSGGLANWRWSALAKTSGTVAGNPATQAAFVQFDNNGSVGTPAILPLPTLTVDGTPTTDSVMASFVLPANTFYGVLSLKAQSGSDELLLWDVYLPPDVTSFEFVRLPDQAATPLVPGRGYTLTLTAYGSSGNGGVIAQSDNTYRIVTTYLQSISATEWGVDAFSSVQVTFSL